MPRTFVYAESVAATSLIAAEVTVVCLMSPAHAAPHDETRPR
jgi:hypothetical protein